MGGWIYGFTGRLRGLLSSRSADIDVDADHDLVTTRWARPGGISQLRC
jgi:hypothetical protein